MGLYKQIKGLIDLKTSAKIGIIIAHKKSKLRISSMLSHFKILIVVCFILFFTSCQDKKAVKNIETKTQETTDVIQEQRQEIKDVGQGIQTLSRDIRSSNSKREDVEKKVVDKVESIHTQTTENRTQLKQIHTDVQVTRERINEGAKLKYIDLLQKENSFPKKIVLAKAYLSSLNFAQNEKALNNKAEDEKNAKALEEFFTDVDSLMMRVSADVKDNEIMENLSNQVDEEDRGRISHLDSLKAISLNLSEYSKNYSLYQMFLKVLRKFPEINSEQISRHLLTHTESVIIENYKVIYYLLSLRLNTYLAVFINKYTNYNEKNSVVRFVTNYLNFSNYETQFFKKMDKVEEIKIIKSYLDLINYTFESYSKLPIRFELNKDLIRIFKRVEFEDATSKNISHNQMTQLSEWKSSFNQIKKSVEILDR